MSTISHIGFIILLLLSGCASQNITFPSNVTQQISSCKDGSTIDGVDRIKHFGQVETGETRKEIVLSFETRNGSNPTSSFVEDCFVDVDGTGCGHMTWLQCYCASQDTKTSYTLVYNRPADIAKSQYLLRLRWQPGQVISGTPVQMPVVHRKVGISVTCSGKKCFPSDGVQSNPYTFCVSNLESPTLSIEIGDAVRAIANSSCISYSILDNETNSELVLHYDEGSGCQRNGNKTWLTVPTTNASHTTMTPVPGPNVVLHLPIKGPDCTQGARDEDTLKIIGIITGVSNVDLNDWKDVDFVSRKKISTDFEDVCTLNLPACGYQSSTICKCIVRTVDIYEVYYESPAKNLRGIAEVKIVLRKVTDPMYTKESALGTIPTIFDKHSEVLTLTVNDVPKNKQFCELPEGAKRYRITYCCTGSALPCNLRIQFGHREITGSSCINQTVAAFDKYIFSHSVCDTKYDAGEFTCSISTSATFKIAAAVAGLVLICSLAFGASAVGFYKVLKKPALSRPRGAATKADAAKLEGMVSAPESKFSGSSGSSISQGSGTHV